MPHVEFRLPVRQRLYWLALGGLWLPVAALRLAAGGIPTGVIALVIAGASTGAFVVSGQYGVTLTPHYVVLRGMRRRVIAWHDIRDVTAADFVSSRRVALHLADGSTTRPWTPLHNWAQPDPEFDRTFHTIYDWWFGARTGAPCAPPAPTAAAHTLVTGRTTGSPPPATRPVPRRSTTG